VRWVARFGSADDGSVMAVTETGHLAAREVDDLYRRHGAEVYRYAYAVLGNHADAEDVTQTTFLNAYRAFQRGEEIRNYSGGDPELLGEGQQANRWEVKIGASGRLLLPRCWFDARLMPL